MFAGEFPSHVEAGGLFRLPPIFLAAFPPPEEAVGRHVVLLKSLDCSLWLYQAQGWEAKLDAIREQLNTEQSRLLMYYVVAESVLAELDPQGRLAIPKVLRTYADITTKPQYQAAEETFQLAKKHMWIQGQTYESPRAYRKRVGSS